MPPASFEIGLNWAVGLSGTLAVAGRQRHPSVARLFDLAAMARAKTSLPSWAMRPAVRYYPLNVGDRLALAVGLLSLAWVVELLVLLQLPHSFSLMPALV